MRRSIAIIVLTLAAGAFAAPPAAWAHRGEGGHHHHHSDPPAAAAPATPLGTAPNGGAPLAADLGCYWAPQSTAAGIRDVQVCN